MTQAMTAPAGYKDPFDYPRYIIRKKVFKLLGAAFHVYDEAGNLIMYSRQKAFKLKEDIRLYSDETMKVELLTITARQVVDFSAASIRWPNRRLARCGARDGARSCATSG